jgi:predicted dehydrogenase
LSGYLLGVAITIAVLGTGSIGTRHYNCLKTIEGVTPIAVPSRPERVAELQSQGINALDQVPDEAQGIVIATDTARHLSDWQKFQDRVCLVEKPLAGEITPELESLVAQTKGRAFTACVLRFNRTLTEFKKIVTDQGPPDFIAIKCASYLPDWRPNRDYRTLYSAKPNQGGALRELIHEIDYAGWIFGWPTIIQGQLTPATQIEIADEETAKLLWQNAKTKIIFELDLVTKTTMRMALAKYAENSIIANLVENKILEENNLKVNTIEFAEPRDAMYTRQLEAFVRAIEGENSAPLATAEEGLKALQVIQAVRLSSATDQPVSL